MSDVAGLWQPARRGARKNGGPLRGSGFGSSGQTTSLPSSNASNRLSRVTLAKQASTFGSARVSGSARVAVVIVISPRSGTMRATSDR